MHVALVTGSADPSAEIDAPLVAALEHRHAQVHTPRWDEPTVGWGRFDVTVVRTSWDGAGDREGFLAWATEASQRTALWNPADVLRWNTHRSYLLELEDRGAPVVPTAWLAQGDRVELGELLASRRWERAVVRAASVAAEAGPVRVVADAIASGQQHLDDLLAVGDVMVQPYLAAIETRGELSVVVIDGEVSHAVRRWPRAEELRVEQGRRGRHEVVELDRETRALARWVVEATGTELLYARVDLLEDELGSLQLAALEATAPDLYLDAAPDAVARLADAVLRRG